MPNVRSKLKDALDEELKRASYVLLIYPQESDAIKVALEYINSIKRIIDVCEKRNRY